MPCLNVIDIGDTKKAAQLFRRDLHRARAFSFARRGLREGCRKRSVESHVALDFLHGLMNMSETPTSLGTWFWRLRPREGAHSPCGPIWARSAMSAAFSRRAYTTSPAVLFS